MPVLILGGGQQDGGSGVIVSLPATARTRPSVTVGLQAWAATRREPVIVGLLATATTLVPDLEALTGSPVLETDSSVTGLPGDVLSWAYTHSGQYEELSVVVTGQHGLALPTAVVQAEAYVVPADGKRVKIGGLSPRGFRQLGAEPEVDAGQDQTTFTFRNSFDQALRGTVLPEFIPWKLSPTPGGSAGACAARPRQRVRVSDVVHQALSSIGGFILAEDPLTGAEWVEGERDMSTAGLTPEALWGQTYGALGMALHVLPREGGFSLIGRFTGPPVGSSDGSGNTSLDAWVTGRTERRERLQTPGSLTVRGGPQVTALDFPTLMKWIGDDPARDEISRALGPGSEWFEESSADTGTTRRGFRKARGQLVAQVELTTGEVVAKETVDGKEVSVTFADVVLGYGSTTTTYDPDCADRPLLQRTTNRTYAYTPFTKTQSVQVAGPGIFTSAPAGELASSEEAVTTFTYSPQGWQTSKVTTTTRLGSLQQEDAEEEPEKRGKITLKEELTDVTAETWLLTGAGRWQHTVRRSVQSLVPVYDQESGEAIRTSTVTRTLPPIIENTDQAPPSYRCPDDCLRDVAVPTGVVVSAGDAGFAQATELDLPFAGPGMLERVSRRVLLDQWHREVRTFEVAYPVGVFPGAGWGGGMVRSVSLRGDSTGVQSTVEVAAHDGAFGGPGAASGITADARQGTGIMLAGRPGGARVRITTGWDPQAQTAIIEDTFVAFRTGFPPTPGDEISWTLVQGRREAQSAR